MHEFAIIKHYFAEQAKHRSDVVCGIGDDAAIVKLPPDKELAITTDTLVAGVHFPETTLPYDIGYKALAVNLSDLAAMGASPAWVTLALTLPEANQAWLRAFCDGFFTLANRFQIQLIGGDLTRGPLSITVTAMGSLPANQALLRSTAKPTDLIYVSGCLGDAGLALKFLQQDIKLNAEAQHFVLERLHRPEPRIALGTALLSLASAAIDISDGFAADLTHILDESGVGACVNIDKLPLSQALTQAVPPAEAIALALSAGDDYELCFTIPQAKRKTAEKVLSSFPCAYTCVGEITQQRGLRLCHQDGSAYHDTIMGYQHF